MATAASIILCTESAHFPEVRIPFSAVTQAGFRAWAKSDEFPARGQFACIAGNLFVDLNREELETHNKVRSEICRLIGGLIREGDSGEFFGRGALFTNKEAELSNGPEATFVSFESYKKNRARLIPREGETGQYMEIEGSADWVLEVVSNGSLHKDKVLLREHYARANINEYWLIDARKSEIDFQLLQLFEGGYEPASKCDGWQRSAVFQRWFRLERQRNRLGRWEYTLNVRIELGEGNGTPS